MELRVGCLGLLCLLYLSTATTFMSACEARSSTELKSQSARHSRSQKLKALKHIDAAYSSSDPYYMGSPTSLPPYEDVMGPSSSPQDNPPYCIYPPFTPLPPSTILPTPIVPLLTPPSPLPPTSYNTPPVLTPNPPVYPTPSAPEFVPSPPAYVPSPPEYVPTPPVIVPSPPSYVPTPPVIVPSPPSYVPAPPVIVPNPPGYVPIYFPNPPPAFNPSPPSFVPSPPSYIPNPPPGFIPSPPEFVPGPIIFQPPVVYPPPSVPPPPSAPTYPGLWCVAKPTVPDPIIQEAMNYACGSGADCDSILPNGSCFQPDTLIAHASFAFNSYWQRTKVAGGTCDFGRTAMLITNDPSYDGCHFIFY